MCFIKSSAKPETIDAVEQNTVQRHEANASITKNSIQKEAVNQRDIKTTPFGIKEEAPVNKKTLLGE